MKTKFLTGNQFYNLPKNQRTGCVLSPNGDKHFYKEDLLHREDGPAIEFASGEKHWYYENRFHRLDGPAVEYANGKVEYYLEGKKYSYTEWYAILNNLEKFI